MRVLALMCAISGLLTLASAAMPLDPRSPLAVIRPLGAAGIVMAVAVQLLARRWPAGVVHVGFAIFSSLVGSRRPCRSPRWG